MRHLKKFLAHAGRGLALTLSAVAFCTPGHAQNIFSAAATVNNSVITEYEVAQRQRFLTLLNAPGSGRASVLQELITERLRNQAASEAGFELTEEQILAGIDEFAARVELGGAEFITVIEENGVAEETLRAFVRSGIAWREYVRARFGPRVQVTEADIDQALGTSGSGGNVRVLLTEVVIPAEPQNRAQVEDIAQQVAAADSAAQFEAFARDFSAAPTRTNGGRLPWRSLDELPPALRPILLSLAPGEISDPIPLPTAFVVFQLRDIEEIGGGEESFAAIEYAAYLIPGGRSEAALREAARLRARIDTCDDLYGEALGQPPEVLQRDSRPPADIPADVARELAMLDPGEVSTNLTRAGGQTLVFLMLCGRTAAVNQDVDRAEVANVLRSSRINAYADSLEEQLRADARIIIP